MIIKIGLTINQTINQTNSGGGFFCVLKRVTLRQTLSIVKHSEEQQNKVLRKAFWNFSEKKKKTDKTLKYRPHAGLILHSNKAL